MNDSDYARRIGVPFYVLFGLSFRFGNDCNPTLRYCYCDLTRGGIVQVCVTVVVFNRPADVPLGTP